jgi:hypothetical protein
MVGRLVVLITSLLLHQVVNAEDLSYNETDDAIFNWTDAEYYNETDAEARVTADNETDVAFKYLPTLTNISVMDYSATYRQSVCEQQRAFSNGTLEFRDSLRGLSLNVMLFTGSFGGLDPIDGSIPTSNLEMDVIVLDELARRAGFTWRTTYGAVSPENETASFDDLLDVSRRVDL